MVKKYGISMIALVITVIVILILTTTVIINISNNNSINAASQATFETDIASFQSKLDIYLNDISMQTAGVFEKEYFSANKTSMTYTGDGDFSTSGKTMYDIFPSMKGTIYEKFLSVKQGELAYDETKMNKQQKKWIRNILNNK